MNTPLRSMLFAAALLAAGTALAAADTTVRIIHDGHSETLQIPFDTLQPGESRQLATAGGTPAIVTRTDEGLRIEMAGRTTEVPLPPLRDGAALAGGEGKRVMVLHAHDAHAGTDGEARVRMHRLGDDAQAPFDPAELEALLEGAGDTAGNRVIVVRKREAHSAD